MHITIGSINTAISAYFKHSLIMCNVPYCWLYYKLKNYIIMLLMELFHCGLPGKSFLILYRISNHGQCKFCLVRTVYLLHYYFCYTLMTSVLVSTTWQNYADDVLICSIYILNLTVLHNKMTLTNLVMGLMHGSWN